MCLRNKMSMHLLNNDIDIAATEVKDSSMEKF